MNTHETDLPDNGHVVYKVVRTSFQDSEIITS